MPTTLTQTDIANMALMKVGAQPIEDIGDQQSSSAQACRVNWQLSYLVVSRAHQWNCLTKRLILPAAPNPTTPGGGTPTSVPWAPFTTYTVGTYVSYGGAIYVAAFTAESTANFTIDLTQGYWFQADYPDYNAFPNNQAFPGGTISGWSYAYQLPADFVLMTNLNEFNTWGQMQYGNLYEIQEQLLYTNAETANIRYISNITDVSRFDALFVDALVWMLASKIATPLRLDSGNMQPMLLAAYNAAIATARRTDANERKPNPFNPVGQSGWLRARNWGTNG